MSFPLLAVVAVVSSWLKLAAAPPFLCCSRRRPPGSRRLRPVPSCVPVAAGNGPGCATGGAGGRPELWRLGAPSAVCLTRTSWAASWALLATKWGDSTERGRWCQGRHPQEVVSPRLARGESRGQVRHQRATESSDWLRPAGRPSGALVARPAASRPRLAAPGSVVRPATNVRRGRGVLRGAVAARLPVMVRPWAGPGSWS